MPGDINAPTHTVKKVLAYSCEQLFDMVADIECYPEFLSGWVEARIIEQTDNYLRVRQQLGLPLLSQSFISTAELERPSQLTIRSNDGPFQNLLITWKFQPVESERCEVMLDVKVTLRSRVLDRLAEAFRVKAASDVLTRFESRAHVLYDMKRDS